MIDVASIEIVREPRQGEVLRVPGARAACQHELPVALVVSANTSEGMFAPKLVVVLPLRPNVASGEPSALRRIAKKSVSEAKPAVGPLE